MAILCLPAKGLGSSGSSASRYFDITDEEVAYLFWPGHLPGTASREQVGNHILDFIKKKQEGINVCG